MKKGLIIFLIVLGVLVILGVGGFFLFKAKKPAEEGIPTPKPEGVLIEVPLEEQPYVVLIPRADGKEFTMEISNIKDANTIEYELVYLSQGLSRGVVGAINLNGETTISRKLLLGTCSRNVCKYDEGVEEGTLTLRLRGAGGTRKVTADFHLQKGVNELTSVDGKFKFTGKLPTGSYYLTMSTIGLLVPIEKEILAGPYGIFTAGSTSIKGGKVFFEDINSSAEIYAWSEKAWEKLENSQANLLSVFIAAQ